MKLNQLCFGTSTMFKRAIGLLALAGLGLFGGAGSAHATEWMWIAAPTWSYSASTCATPGASFYAWIIADASTFATTACAGPVGESSSVAAATPGVGGFGAAEAAGFADPSVNLTLPGDYDAHSQPSASSFNFIVDPHTGDVEGLGFSPSGKNSIIGSPASDQIGVFLFSGNQCSALTGSSVCPNGTQTSGGTQPMNLAGLEAAGVLTSEDVLGQFDDELSPVEYLPFSSEIPLGDEPDIVLMAFGQAVSTPEPGSLPILGFGLGLIGFLLIARRRRVCNP